MSIPGTEGAIFGGSSAASASTVPPALRDPAHQVSPKAPITWAAGAVAADVLLAAGLVTAHLTGLISVPVWGWILYAVVSVAHATSMPMIRYRVHRWETTDAAVYTQTGWLSRERRIAPMSRVQTVDLDQGPVQRVVGLATVTVTTASAAGPLQIAGLDKAVADRLVEELTRRAEEHRGDAT